MRAADRGIRSVVIRLPLFVYGRGGSTFIPMQIKAGLKTGVVRYIESGSNNLSAVYVDDAAQLYLLALEKAPAGSIFHVATQAGITAKGIAEAISHVVGR